MQILVINQSSLSLKWEQIHKDIKLKNKTLKKKSWA